MVIAKIQNAKRLIVKNKFDSVKTNQFTKNEQLKKGRLQKPSFFNPSQPPFIKEGLGKILLTIKGNIATRI